MVEFPARPARTNPDSRTNTNLPSHGAEKRRGVRLNSRVPIAFEWDSKGETRHGEAQTRVIGHYGCLAVIRDDIELDQRIQLTNLASSQSNPAVVVWRGSKRPEGCEVGIELINPEVDFWGLEL